MGNKVWFTAFSRNKVLIIFSPENFSIKGLGAIMNAFGRFSVAKFGSKIE